MGAGSKAPMTDCCSYSGNYCFCFVKSWLVLQYFPWCFIFWRYHRFAHLEPSFIFGINCLRLGSYLLFVRNCLAQRAGQVHHFRPNGLWTLNLRRCCREWYHHPWPSTRCSFIVFVDSVFLHWGCWTVVGWLWSSAIPPQCSRRLPQESPCFANGSLASSVRNIGCPRSWKGPSNWMGTFAGFWHLIRLPFGAESVCHSWTLTKRGKSCSGNLGQPSKGLRMEAAVRSGPRESGLISLFIALIRHFLGYS